MPLARCGRQETCSACLYKDSASGTAFSSSMSRFSSIPARLLYVAMLPGSISRAFLPGSSESIGRRFARERCGSDCLDQPVEPFCWEQSPKSSRKRIGRNPKRDARHSVLIDTQSLSAGNDDQRAIGKDLDAILQIVACRDTVRTNRQILPAVRVRETQLAVWTRKSDRRCSTAPFKKIQGQCGERFECARLLQEQFQSN